MKRFEQADLLLLRPALIKLGWITGLLCALWGGTALVASEAAARRQAMESELLDIRARYISAGHARQAFRTYEGRFQALHEAGVINDEPRLGWVEAVQFGAERLHLHSVQFTLEPAAPLALEHPVVAAPLAASTMRLQMELVHEGELLAFLDQLRAVAPAIFWTRYCDLDRGEGMPSFAPRQKNLSASCELMWITVHTEPVAEAAP